MTDLRTNRRGHDGPSWTPFSYTMRFLLMLSLLPSTVGMTDHRRHNGPSRLFVSKHLNYWNLGTGNTSLIFMTNQQDGPSWLRLTVMHPVTPQLVRLPHLSSAAALRCHLRIVTSMMDRHKLRRWYFSVFLAQKPSHSSFRQISYK